MPSVAREFSDMRMAELSRRSGVAVPTIKYYLREELLPPGELTSPNQAGYNEEHLRRLRLIRALVEVGSVPIAGLRTILGALGAQGDPLHDRIGEVQRAITRPPRADHGDEQTDMAATEIRALIERRGWTVAEHAPAIGLLVETVATMRALGQEHLLRLLDAYAEQAERVAELEVAAVTALEHPEQIAESMVIGTVLGERLLAAMRLLTHESVSARVLQHQPVRSAPDQEHQD
jgi:DNA-binding transcriptional MerR regulator